MIMASGFFEGFRAPSAPFDSQFRGKGGAGAVGLLSRVVEHTLLYSFWDTMTPL